MWQYVEPAHYSERMYNGVDQLWIARVKAMPTLLIFLFAAVIQKFRSRQIGTVHNPQPSDEEDERQAWQAHAP
jgi:hypothetical protein